MLRRDWTREDWENIIVDVHRLDRTMSGVLEEHQLVNAVGGEFKELLAKKQMSQGV